MIIFYTNVVNYMLFHFGNKDGRVLTEVLQGEGGRSGERERERKGGKAYRIRNHVSHLSLKS